VADRGWVLRPGSDRWRLNGPDGRAVTGVALQFVTAYGAAPVNAYGARRGWPVLVPGSPWIHCVLTGGPEAGRHEYLDPAVWDGPPPVLYLHAAARLPEQAVMVAYWRQVQVCGHGRSCPYRYEWAALVVDFRRIVRHDRCCNYHCPHRGELHAMSPADPRLARRLRDIRLRLGWSGETAAAKAGWSPSKISRIERLRTGVSPGDVEVLLGIYGVSPGERAALVALASQPRAMQDVIYRDEAATADLWAPSLIPPLLRIPAYTLAVGTAAAALTGTLPSQVAADAAASSAWKERIAARRHPLKVRAVIDAAVLRRRVAAPEVMRRQIEHLTWVDSRPNGEVLVLPLDAGGYPAGLAAFTLLGFDALDDGLPLGDVAVFDDPSAPRTDDTERVTWRCRQAFRELRDVAEAPAAAITAATAHWSR
jgi:transcriptional regulator with XRE-family HTH domain